MVQRRLFVRSALCLGVVAGLVGCSSVSSLLDADKIDYKTASEKKSAPRLDVPPDLTQLKRDDRYAMPDGTVTATGYQQKQAEKPRNETVAPQHLGADIRLERAGGQRWLVVNQTPEALWPEVKTFWQDQGFLLKIERSDTGIMETEWAENRAKIPQDIIRRTLGKVLDSLYSTGEVDKFRTRLERGPNGVTEIYISHRGAREELMSGDTGQTVWVPRPADPELEAEFLARLMLRLGATEEQAKSAVANPVVLPARAKLVKGSEPGEAYIQATEGFDRTWRRVGLALDRVGFTVEDRDRSNGLYFVRYIDQDKVKTKKKGWFFSSSDDEPDVSKQRYRVLVKGDEGASQVSVLDNDGKPERSSTGTKILALLLEQLK